MTKPTENELFEKWYDDNADYIEMVDYKIWCRTVWNARAELADKEKTELQQTIARQSMQIAHDAITLESYNNKFFQMQAQINELREALKFTLYSLEGRGIPPNVNPSDLTVQYYKCKQVLQEALAKTAPQSLIEHDNEVIERCAKVCDERENDARCRLNDDEKSSVAYLCAAAIRALKGVQHG